MHLVLASSLSAALLLSACTSSQTFEVGPGEGVETTTSIETTTTADTEPSSGTSVETAVDYLLTQEDLPGREYSRPMEFAPEPTFEALGCDAMNTAWSAHGIGGTRIRSAVDNYAFRQTVVEMPDVATAEAIIEAVDVVWQECNPLTVSSQGEWWVEPIETPEVDGWQTAGLAFGLGQSVSTITWFQKGTVVVFLDLDGESPWDAARDVQKAIAARLVGNPMPMAQPVPDTVPERTTATDGSYTTPDEPDLEPDYEYEESRWKDHPAAKYVPDASLFGDGFELGDVRINEAEPSDPSNGIAECGLSAPPLLDGLEPEFVHESDRTEVELLIGTGNAEWAQESVDLFRELSECDPENIGLAEIELLETNSAADDAVILRIFGEEEEVFVTGLVFLGRYDDAVIGIFFAADDDGEVKLPSIETLTAWADGIAAKGAS